VADISIRQMSSNFYPARKWATCFVQDASVNVTSRYVRAAGNSLWWTVFTIYI
jgi:hypothetical protein